MRTYRPLIALTLALTACAGNTTTASPQPTATTGARSTPTATTAVTSTPVATTAPAAASAASPAPSASQAPAYAAVGSASATIAQSKQTTATGTYHVGFIGDEPLPPGTYAEQLNLVTLQPGGRTVAHKHGGVEWVYVTEGTVEVRLGSGGRTTLTVGQNAKVPAGTPIQAINNGTTIAKFLAFFVTADGQPFQTNLETAP